MSGTIGWTGDAGGFGTPDPSDDSYHGLGEEKSPTMTETWFWAIQHPESKLHGFVYIWIHPNLGTCTGGLFCHFGNKPNMLSCELFDFVTFASSDIFTPEGDIVLPNGLRVQFEEPTRRARITYENAIRGFSLDMVQEAFMPVAKRSNNKHFEQGMRVSGTASYQGQVYPLDHLSVRDRSWGEPRPEGGLALPPYTWMTGAFSEDFAFTIAMHDDSSRGPEWKDQYDIPPSQALRDGWIWTDGRLEKVVSGSKITKRDPRTLVPRSHEMEVTTESGRTYRFSGTVISTAPFSTWHNVWVHIGMTRWRCEEVEGEGWGDTQEVQWNDYVARFTPTDDPL